MYKTVWACRKHWVVLIRWHTHTHTHSLETVKQTGQTNEQCHERGETEAANWSSLLTPPVSMTTGNWAAIWAVHRFVRLFIGNETGTTCSAPTPANTPQTFNMRISDLTASVCQMQHVEHQPALWDLLMWSVECVYLRCHWMRQRIYLWQKTAT